MRIQAGAAAGFGRWHWLVLYLAICGAWAGLFRISLPPGSLDGMLVYGAAFWMGLCSVSPARAGYSGVLGMWLLMSAAMMLPTIVPALKTYDELRSAGAGSRQGFLELISGFLLLWVAYSLAMSLVQIHLAGYLPAVGGEPTHGWWIAAAILAAAGIYQFLPLKDACLTKCRTPFMFFMANWRASPVNELWLGLKMGAVCVGCCGLFMAVALIAGAMSLLWMGIATLIMCIEKHPDAGRYVSRPLGLVLIGAAAIAVMSGI